MMFESALQRFGNALSESLQQQADRDEEQAATGPSIAQLAAGLDALMALRQYLVTGRDVPVTPYQREALGISTSTLRRWLDRERRVQR